MDRISLFCFGASYTLALMMELWQLARPGLGWRRIVALVSAVAGLTAHVIYIVHHGLPFRGTPSSLLFLSLILAVFYVVGSIHHRQQAWGIFVLPVVIGLVIAAAVAPEPSDTRLAVTDSVHVWAWGHFLLLLASAVGLCVGFVASVMYLVQAWKLRHKKPPGQGLRLLSLERLEEMNRRAITLAFPLLTAGLLIGVALLLQTRQLEWTDPKVITAALLWLVFAVLVYVRFGLHQRGRRVAWWTITAFGFMVLAFVVQFFWPSTHPTGGRL